MQENRLRKLSPSVKIVPLANGSMPEAVLKNVFPLFGVKFSKKHFPLPEDLENCLRLVPVKLEIRDMLKERVVGFLSEVDFLEAKASDASTTLMIPSFIKGVSEADNQKFIEIWHDVINGIVAGIDRMAEVTEEGARQMNERLLSELVTTNLDITVTAWDLRTWLEGEFDDFPLGLEDDELFDDDDDDDDLLDDDEGESFSEPSPFARMLLEETQRVWPWLVEDIADDSDYSDVTVH